MTRTNDQPIQVLFVEIGGRCILRHPERPRSEFPQVSMAFAAMPLFGPSFLVVEEDDRHQAVDQMGGDLGAHHAVRPDGDLAEPGE